MSLDLASERVCYVHCNFCTTILAVSVPASNMSTIVTVRCGHCANLLSVSMAPSLQSILPLQQTPQKQVNINTEGSSKESRGSCSQYNRFSTSLEPKQHQQIQHSRIPPIRPPEKRQRVPSAYNRFIKEEIQRIKASNPDISHREAFSTAAKNKQVISCMGDHIGIMAGYVALYNLLPIHLMQWAHFPRLHFGLKLDGSKPNGLTAESTSNSNGFFEMN